MTHPEFGCWFVEPLRWTADIFLRVLSSDKSTFSIFFVSVLFI